MKHFFIFVAVVVAVVALAAAGYAGWFLLAVAALPH